MQSSYIFKPKYGLEITKRVLGCFVRDYLSWEENGYDFNIRKVDSKHEGWLTLEAWPEHPGGEYFSETSFVEDPITNKQLTEDMLVLLTGDGPAYEEDRDEQEPGYSLYEVEISEVLAALSEVGTRVYSPFGAKIWSLRVGDGHSKREPLLDLLLTQEAA